MKPALFQGGEHRTRILHSGASPSLQRPTFQLFSGFGLGCRLARAGPHPREEGARGLGGGKAHARRTSRKVQENSTCSSPRAHSRRASWWRT